MPVSITPPFSCGEQILAYKSGPFLEMVLSPNEPKVRSLSILLYKNGNKPEHICTGS